MCDICKVSPDCRDHKINIYLNRSLIGKMPSTATGDQWKAFHSRWFSFETTARQMAIEIYRGYSVAHLHNGGKRKENWQSAEYIGLDFDTGDERSTLDYLKKQDFVNWFSSFAYTTPSHTDEAPRARVIWILETPITDFERYTELYKAMLYQFQWADPSTKDVARLFYGSPNCTVWSNWSLLTDGAAAEIVRMWRADNPEPERVNFLAVPAESVNDRYLMAVRDGLLNNILSAPDGEKHTTLNKISYVFGGYIAGGYFNEGDAVTWLEAAVSALPNVQSTAAARSTIIQGIASGKCAPLYIERPANIEERNG